jgi:hypothetical protein
MENTQTDNAEAVRSSAWVKCTERLPKSGRVLVFSPLYKVGNPTRFRVLDAQFVRISKDCTHWMDLDSMNDIVNEYRAEKVMKLCKEAQEIMAQSSFAAPAGSTSRFALTKTISLIVDSETIWLEQRGKFNVVTNIWETCEEGLFALLRRTYSPNEKGQR